MAIKFKVLPRKNPQDITAPEKFYAAAIGDGEIDLDRLAEKIAYQCTLTEVDCHAVLLSLVHNISQELNDGRIVRLGKLGTFQVGISSEGYGYRRGGKSFGNYQNAHSFPTRKKIAKSAE